MRLPTRFGNFGGVFVPEALVPALMELEDAYLDALDDHAFVSRFEALLRDYVGRPSRLTEASRLSAEVGARVLLKREDLNHTGAHKINNTIGQALLAHRMGKPRLIAETGAGQHGVATATAAALLGFDCTVYMGSEDVRRQALNLFRMNLLGAEVVAVESGSRTLKDATNEALRDWVASVGTTHYIIGSVVGPHPFPTIVRRFQRVIGDETRLQCHDLLGRDPDIAVACIGGGSNAIGMFAPFVDDPGCTTKLVGIEAAGHGLESGRHGASISRGVPGVLHGSMSLLLQDEFGQVIEAHSISAGLDYPGVGPEHAHLAESGRAVYESATDEEALEAVKRLARTEGILCALETGHAIAWLLRNRGRLEGQTVVVCLSGRGDKDVNTLMERGLG